jgi:hypothetical protein
MDYKEFVASTLRTIKFKFDNDNCTISVGLNHEALQIVSTVFNKRTVAHGFDQELLIKHMMDLSFETKLNLK